MKSAGYEATPHQWGFRTRKGASARFIGRCCVARALHARAVAG